MVITLENNILIFIQECYEEIPTSIQYTINRLRSNLEFQSSIQKLQSDGWLDWQLLGAIKSVVISYRVKKDLPKFSNISKMSTDKIWIYL